MKITHRTPCPSWFAIPESDPVDDDYADKVRQATERGERQYREAQNRIARAEARLGRTRAQKATGNRKKLISRLEALVAARRAELAELERLMMTPVTADKQVRLRTGLDDHLELGIPPETRNRRPAT
jgi:hypothetical protein